MSNVIVKFSEIAVETRIRMKWMEVMPQISKEILNDCNEFCKMDTGQLIASSYIHSRPENGILVWRTPYARRQYWEIRTAYKDENPKATWKWCEAAKATYAGKWNAQVAMMMDARTGGGGGGGLMTIGNLNPTIGGVGK
jgi:hypothetical protein